ncbi:refilin-B-like isoform X3 [Pecten maximus]|uniref:refilin-B-like isoform X1 n=1 Tax=Pecten maximus TaxID=6579 RepID=UPI001458AF88|nr:refilin-B-like isoform X1 [Pecten maximus]XP_033747439.1 refilin-B-like isoform X2 [Pecten maximus]XP_033747440.1 refilin-B-like isoform X3 [Pecten maximus]
MKLTPDHVEETLAVVKLPNFEDKYDVSTVTYDNMKRFHGEVHMEPTLTPVHHKDTIILFSNCTKKRFVSHTYYEPKVKPRHFSETLVIYPKRPCKVFASCMDYHIDECRKWYRTSMEFTARTFTTKRIQKRKMDKQTSSKTDSKCFSDPDGPGASTILLPRYNRDKTAEKEDVTIQNINLMNAGLVNGYNGLSNGHIVNEDMLNGELMNGDILIPGIESHRWV